MYKIISIGLIFALLFSTISYGIDFNMIDSLTPDSIPNTNNNSNGDNLAPTVDFSVSSQIKVDVNFKLGNTTKDNTTLTNSINSIMKPLLSSNKIDASITTSVAPTENLFGQPEYISTFPKQYPIILSSPVVTSRGSVYKNLLKASDGSYVVVGESGEGNTYWRDVFSGGGHISVPYIVKYDASGNKIWDKLYCDSRPYYFSWATWNMPVNPSGYFSVVENGGGYIAVGTADDVTIITKFNSSGTVVWNKTLGYSGFKSISNDTDGGFIVCGGSSIAKYDNSGNQIWTRTINGSAPMYYKTELDGVESISDGYIVCGTSSSMGVGDFAGTNRITDTTTYTNNTWYWQNTIPFVAKFDKSGNKVWLKDASGVLTVSSSNRSGSTFLAVNSSGIYVACNDSISKFSYNGVYITGIALPTTSGYVPSGRVFNVGTGIVISYNKYVWEGSSKNGSYVARPYYDKYSLKDVFLWSLSAGAGNIIDCLIGTDNFYVGVCATSFAKFPFLNISSINGVTYHHVSPVLSDLTNGTSFRSDANIKIVVLVQDYKVFCWDNDMLAVVNSELTSQNILFYPFCTAENLAQMDILKGTSNSINISGLDSNVSVTTLTNHILSNATSMSSIPQMYLLLNDQYTTSSFIADREDDPEYTVKYRITHTDPNYYDNSLGTMANSGQLFDNIPLSFDKTGKFLIGAIATDNPKNVIIFDPYKKKNDENKAQKYIYVHRKPVALFNVTFTGRSGLNTLINISDISYDLDHTSRGDKGLTTKTWQWKLNSDSAWTNGMIATTLPPNQKYDIKLVVTDMEGVSSDAYQVIIDTNVINLAPVLTVIPLNKYWIGNNKTNVSATITATENIDHNLGSLKYMWSASPVKPSSGWITVTGTNTIITQVTTTPGQGSYYLHAEAFDTFSPVSSTYNVFGPYNVDWTPPVVSSDIATLESFEPIDVYVTTTDSLSGIDYVNYKWSTSISKPSSGWTTTANSEFYTTLTDDSATYYLHIEAFDRAGNSTYVMKGSYKVNSLQMYDFTITSMLDIAWRGYYFDLAQPFDDNNDGKTDRYQAKSNTEIKSNLMPVNSRGVISYGITSVKAGYKVSGYVYVRGSPDTVSFSALYSENSVGKFSVITCTADPIIPMKYNWEYIIPLVADNNSMIVFSASMVKGGITYSDERWIDIWAVGYTRQVLYIKGKATDDFQFTQEQ
jgi:hypothetical protein